MNRFLVSSLGRRLAFTSTCREFSAASGLLKPYVPSISNNSLMPSSKSSSSSSKGLAGGRLLSTAATAAYDQSIQSVFPSLVISNKSVEAQGPFAEAQAQVCPKFMMHHDFLSQFIKTSADVLLIDYLCIILVVSCVLNIRNPFFSVFGPRSRSCRCP